MLNTVLKIETLLVTLNNSKARIEMIKTAAREFDAEVSANEIYNVTATKMKDALYMIDRAFEAVRIVHGYQSPVALTLGALYYELPYSIDGGTVKKAIRNLQAAINTPGLELDVVTNLKLQLFVAEVFADATVELRAVKDKLIKGRKISVEEKQDAIVKQARVAASANSPITQLVAPIREKSVDIAEARMREQIALVKSKFEENGWDISKVAPRPGTNVSRKDYNRAMLKHNFYSQFIKLIDDFNQQIEPVIKDKPVYELDVKNIERVIARVRAETALEFDAYVIKLNAKVGAHTAAVLVDTNGLWNDSTIDVTLTSGKVERWNTKTIINVSVLGKMFNQFPTRLVK
jgi:hypothetical protein